MVCLLISITMKTSKNELIELVKLVRGYGHRMIVDLKEEEQTWTPPNTKGRSIKSYFLHIINAEIFWLLKQGHENLEYIGPDNPMDIIIEGYDKMEEYLLKTIEKSEGEQLEIIPHVLDKEQTIQMGTLGWMIWRTSMHAVHHFAQMAYIRFALENPPIEDSTYSWSRVMDTIVMLKHGIQE
ncbi:hypothetical protein NEF87_003173 [Candidatus Lokiarchaeum ossiferum]|uniref:DinB family protein n=1 Tax=Candidatus Lokiarchaeum ossiferum TaxID=2951803 RepID=A0ABY6HTP4_9ARCH|nr:hypothetical protein NEF87_003173 [Candidatus Lokiarchaeum sp. B-35]